MTVFLAGFDFEARLTPTANGQGVVLPSRVRERMGPLAGLFLLLAEDGDTVRCPGFDPPTVTTDPRSCDPPPPRATLERTRIATGRPAVVDGVVPWGRTDAATGDGPSLMQRLVDRRWWAARQWEWHAAGLFPLDGVDRVQMPPLTDATPVEFGSDFASRPLLHKAAFSAFGRGCRRSGENVATLAAWIDRCSRQGGIVTEWEFAIEEEAASHFIVTGGGGTFLGHSRLTVDDCFQCAGVEVSGRPGPGVESDDRVRRVLQTAASLGYRGPLSIDHARVRHPDDPQATAWRLLQDINPRLTIGSVALRAARRWNRAVAIGLADDWRPDFDIAGTWLLGGRSSRVRVFFGPPGDYGPPVPLT